MQNKNNTQQFNPRDRLPASRDFCVSSTYAGYLHYFEGYSIMVTELTSYGGGKK